MSELRRVGHKVLAVKCDVSDESQAAAMVERAVAEFGGLDMAFNNVGIAGPSGLFFEETAEQFDQVNAVNLGGGWTRTKHELKQMRAQSGGAIVETPMFRALTGNTRCHERSNARSAPGTPWSSRRNCCCCPMAVQFCCQLRCRCGTRS
jgi:NAD(P)-dependent dehydrogenase (short-subunit alcohol dehydrogenase family)